MQRQPSSQDVGDRGARTGGRERRGKLNARGRAALYTRGDYLVASPADQNTLARLVGRLRDAEFDRLSG